MSSYDFEVKPGKVILYKNGDINYLTYYVKLRCDARNRKSVNHISYRWRLGKIRADKSEFYSASFKKWIKLYNSDGRYGFYREEHLPDPQESYHHYLAEEILEVVDAMIAEHFLLQTSKIT